MAGEREEGSGERLHSGGPSPSWSSFIWASLHGCLPCPESQTLWEMNVVLSVGSGGVWAMILEGPRLVSPSPFMPPWNNGGARGSVSYRNYSVRMCGNSQSLVSPKGTFQTAE